MTILHPQAAWPDGSGGTITDSFPVAKMAQRERFVQPYFWRINSITVFCRSFNFTWSMRPVCQCAM